MNRFFKEQKKIFGALLVLVLVITIVSASAVFASERNSNSDENVSVVDDSSSASLNKRVPLTKEEKEYIKKHPTVIVAADASWRPIEYLCDDDGNYEGIISQVLNRISYYTGLKFEYKIKDNYNDALKDVASGKANMVSGIANDPNIAGEYNMILTNPYLTINSAVVAKNTVTGLYDAKQHKNIAVVKEDSANNSIKANLPNTTLVELTSNEECLKAIKNEEVDMAIIATYCSEYYMSVPKYSSLKSYTLSDFSWQQSFGINKNNDEILVGILNKGISEVSKLDLDQAVYEGVMQGTYDNDLMSFVYKHPLVVIGVVTAIILIIGGLILTNYIARRKEHIRQIEDGTRLRLALERTHLCIWEYDLRTMTIDKLDNSHEKHGFYDLRHGIPERIIDAGYIHPEDVCIVREVLTKVNKGEQDVSGCWRIKNIDSEGHDTTYWWEKVLFHIVFDEHHKPIKAIGVSEDVTKEKNAQKDSLTLVYNRNSFEERANLVLQERRNSYLQCAYLILDLDGFKQINDTYGHREGDKVLISVGSVLNKMFRESDVVGRLGGDEFTVFMTSVSKNEDAERKAEEVVNTISKIHETDGFSFSISCSVGVVVGTRGKETLDELYKKADTALYNAKRAGKNQYRIY